MHGTAGAENMISKETEGAVLQNGFESSTVPHKEKEVISQRQPLKWTNIIMLSIIHIGAVSTIFWLPKAKFLTFLFSFIYGYAGGLGTTGGAHRLWTHRSYKANLRLRSLLAVMYTSSGMNPLFEWVRDHRVHHKFSDTDADPHNASRGLFFSHVGWLLQKKHPEVLRRGKQIDMSDILADPVVTWQRKLFVPGWLFLVLVLPISVPCYCWDESFWCSLCFTLSRWVILINIVWSVNSFAHIYGYHPYDQNILPAENKIVAVIGMGEGWHNYHHTFPWDYKTGEYGFYRSNITAAFIDFFAYIGWATDLKEPSKNLIEHVTKQKGDGTHKNWGNIQEVPESAEEALNTEQKIKGI